MLRAVDLVYEAGVAVLGVNLGQLGYLTEVEPDGLDDALERAPRGRLRGDERMMLAVAVVSAGPAARALVGAQRGRAREGARGHTVLLQVAINGAVSRPTRPTG